MDDKTILSRISELVDEEHRLRADAQQHEAGTDDEARERLRALEESLDQCWDLLRRRRAARQAHGDPDAQGRGRGRALTSLGLTYLRDRGLRTVILYTGAENTVAVHTYERAGFARTAVDVMYGPSAPGSPAHGTPLVRVTDTPSSPGGATMGS